MRSLNRLAAKEGRERKEAPSAVLLSVLFAFSVANHSASPSAPIFLAAKERKVLCALCVLLRPILRPLRPRDDLLRHPQPLPHARRRPRPRLRRALGLATGAGGRHPRPLGQPGHRLGRLAGPEPAGHGPAGDLAIDPRAPGAVRGADGARHVALRSELPVRDLRGAAGPVRLPHARARTARAIAGPAAAGRDAAAGTRRDGDGAGVRVHAAGAS